ncbi:hypothetical protein WN48_07589 [Eufriesea mexicana]|uniref:Uncharacterized protein n=1 Tax=Eufriesea mexicana TaxID=516756 RepID=A0A310STS1_9HYME|nr:hypothetical protein WN48_07589 [Eufriesea mexicana]
MPARSQDRQDEPTDVRRKPNTILPWQLKNDNLHKTLWRPTFTSSLLDGKWRLEVSLKAHKNKGLLGSLTDESTIRPKTKCILLLATYHSKTTIRIPTSSTIGRLS